MAMASFASMKSSLFSGILASLALSAGLPLASAHSLRVTVNSSGEGNTADTALTLTEAVLFLNTEFARSEEAPKLGRNLTAQEAAQVIEYTEEERQSVIQFAIPGDGVHFIKPPEGGFPVLFADGVLLDGYTQPGARPNSNPIAAANNAVLTVVLDARELAGLPGEPPPDYTFQIRARGVRFRGFSVLASTASENYGVYFAGGSEGGQISGCWFGVSPDLQILSGGEVAAAAFGSEGGHVVGTNGDGIEDRAEFNVIAAHAIGVMFEETRDITVAGNFIGVLPDGITLPPEEVRAELEGDAVEGADLAGLLTVGTDSDGVADADEANVIGGMKDDVVELYGDAERMVFAGNRVGIGIDGVTPLPIHKLFRTRAGHFRIGSNLDGTRDSEESNWIAHADSFLYRHAPGAFIEFRGNRLTSKSGDLVANLEESHHARILGRPTDLAPVLEVVEPGPRIVGTVPLSGPGEGGLKPAVLDFYVQSLHPDGSLDFDYQYSVLDSVPPEPNWAVGPADENPTVGIVDAVVGGWFSEGVPRSFVAVSRIEDSSGAETGPLSDVATVLVPPKLRIAMRAGELVFTWNGPDDVLESAPSLNAGGWVPIGGQSPVTLSLPNGPAFYRLRTAGTVASKPSAAGHASAGMR